MVPLIYGEIGMCSHEDRKEVPAKSLDGALGLVGAFLNRWNALQFDIVVAERTARVMLGIRCLRPGTGFDGQGF
jgi:hypothetical protein